MFLGINIYPQTLDFDDSCMVFEGFGICNWSRSWTTKPQNLTSKSTKNHLKTGLKSHRKRDLFLHAFWSRKGSPNGSKKGPQQKLDFVPGGAKTREHTAFSHIHVKNIRENTYKSHTWDTLTPLSAQMSTWSQK